MAKLIPVALLLLVAVSFSPAVNAQGPLASFINALMPGASSGQGQSILDPIPPSIKSKIPDDIQKQMQKITVSQIKQDLPAFGKALKKCMMMSSVKECMEELKKVDPELTKLASMIKDKLKPKAKALKQKVIDFLQKLKPMLQSPVLQNIVQTMINVMQPPSGRRRRKRDVLASLTVTIKSLKQQPLTLKDIKDMMKMILKKIKEIMSKPPPSSPLSMMQMIVNAIAKAVPGLKPLLSNPALTKMLGTSPPP